MENRIEAIPTRLRGVRYRSRLEARWAEFFRLLEWDAYYEPFDLDGWIPDFVLHGKLEHCSQIPVEVKPVRSMNDPLFIATANKIKLAGWRGDRLIVSYFLPHDEGDLAVGWLGEAHELQDGRDVPTLDCWWELAPFQETDGSKIAGFCHQFGWYADRITGHYPGGSIAADNLKILELWNEAGNEVQWKK